MKTTPFYELAVAHRGRSTFFQSLVTVVFVVSAFVAVAGTVQLFSRHSSQSIQSARHSPLNFRQAATAQAVVR